MADTAEAREERERLAREQARADLKWLLEQPQGRRTLRRLIFEHGGMQEQGFTQDARQHAFHDGQRQVGISLDRELKQADRRLWALMHQERITELGAELEQDVGNESDH